MEKVEVTQLRSPELPGLLPVSVIVPVRNEARNLPRCLESLRQVGEIYVIDSQSADATAEVARSYGAKVVQFHYPGLAQETPVGHGHASLRL